jgi:Protein of unknown function (DUF3592)
MQKIIPFMLMSCGLFLTALGVFYFIKTTEFKKKAIPTSGRIIDLATRATKAGYAPIIQFQNQKGNQFTYTSYDFRKAGFYKKGDSIDILYDPENPNKVMLNNYFSIWISGYMMLGIGILGILLGIHFFFKK